MFRIGRLSYFLFFLFLLSNKSLLGNDFNRSTLLENKSNNPHSPHVASVLSAVLPGSGQIYNKKYWKAPLVYAGIGGLTYSIIYHQKQFKSYNNELVARSRGTGPINLKYIGYPDEYLRSNRNFVRNNRDLSIIGLAVFYALNIVDAAVDAHLYNFDVDKSLSFRPKLTPNGLTANMGLGVNMCLNISF